MTDEQIIESMGGYDVFKNAVDFQELTDEQHIKLLTIYDTEISDKNVQDSRMYILLQLTDIASRVIPRSSDLQTRLSNELFGPNF